MTENPIKKPWLVQKVKVRRNHTWAPNRVVSDHFGMEYMGSAEYEFGAVPASLRRLGKKHSDAALQIKSLGLLDHRVWVLCRPEEFDPYRPHLQLLANQEHGVLKEWIKFYDHLRGKSGKKSEYDEDLRWDLDNDIVFSLSKEMLTQFSRSIPNSIKWMNKRASEKTAKDR